MSPLQWLAMILAMAAAISVFLAVTSVSLHIFIKTVGRILLHKP